MEVVDLLMWGKFSNFVERTRCNGWMTLGLPGKYAKKLKR